MGIALMGKMRRRRLKYTHIVLGARFEPPNKGETVFSNGVEFDRALGALDFGEFATQTMETALTASFIN